MSVRVVVVGGGVAGVEAALALAELAGDRVTTTLVAAEPVFRVRALTTAEPFASARMLERPLAELPRTEIVVGQVTAVEAEARRVVLAEGAPIEFDVLVLATGAKAVRAVEHATTFGLDRTDDAMSGVLADLEQGFSRSVAFVVPAGVSWPLPAYELALQTARDTAGVGSGAEVHLVTSEPEPLGVFGAEASAAVAGLLDRLDVRFHGGAEAQVPEAQKLVLGDGRVLHADRILALPLLEGPAIAGLPADEGGFVPVDEHGRIAGAPEGFYAAGDGADYPVKQGGLATQQADAVAAHVAAAAGAPVEAEPFTPLLRGRLLTGRGAQLLERGGRSEALELWSPETKVEGRFLSAWLGREAPGAGEGDQEVSVALPTPAEIRRRVADLDPYGPYIAVRLRRR